MTTETVAAKISKAYLLVRSPSSLFLCWTWNRAKEDAFVSGLYEPELTVKLVSVQDNTQCAEMTVRWDAGRLYMNPPAEGLVLNAGIYARKKDGTTEKNLETNVVTVPLSASGDHCSSACTSGEFFRRVLP